jgi:hypothetical protein
MVHDAIIHVSKLQTDNLMRVDDMPDPYFGILSEVPYVSKCLRTGLNQHIVELVILVVKYRQLLQLGSHPSILEVHIIECYCLGRGEIH